VGIVTDKKQSDLTPEEIEAVVYYLTNLENIQKKLLNCAPFPISTNIRKN
jgi:hypothetical protein